MIPRMAKGFYGSDKVTLPGLRIPKDLHDRFLERARSEGTTKSELMRRGMEMYLADGRGFNALTPAEESDVRDIVMATLRTELPAQLRDALRSVLAPGNDDTQLDEEALRQAS